MAAKADELGAKRVTPCAAFSVVVSEGEASPIAETSAASPGIVLATAVVTFGTLSHH